MNGFKKSLIFCEKVVCYLEKAPISIKTWSVSFLAILGVRFLFEATFQNFETLSLVEFLASFFHGTVLFFLFSYVLNIVFLRLIIKEDLGKIANIVLWGQWLAVLPPILDKIIFRGRDVWSFYIFDSLGGVIQRFFTFFGEDPSFGITWGTRIEVFIAMFLLGGYIYIKKKKVRWFFLGTILSYLMLFLLGVFPSIITIFVEMFRGVNIFDVDKTNVIKIFLTPFRYFGIERGTVKTALSLKMSLFYNLLLFVELCFLQFLISKKKFFALLGNVRYPQMFFNIGLVFLGMGLGWHYFPQNFSVSIFSILIIFNTILAVFSAWYFSVFVNDIADFSIDEITNRNRPLITGVFSKEEFKEYSLIFLLLALFSGLVVGMKVLLLISLYLLITWIYSQHPLRLKRFVIISGVLSSFASLLFLVIGYILLSNNQELIMFPWRIVVFLFISYALLIPIKDLKDFEGDKKNGVFTLPTILGVENARIILGVFLFLSYFISTRILNEGKLIIPAMLFGAIGYHIMTSRKYKVTSLPWWILSLVFIYGIILVLITFG